MSKRYWKWGCNTLPKIEQTCACHAEEHMEHSHDERANPLRRTTGLDFARCGAALLLLVCGALLPEHGSPLMWVLHILGWIIAGYDVVWTTLRRIMQGKIFDEHFLMTAATVGAFCIGATAEAVAVMIFYQVGETLQERAVRRSRRSIAALCDIRPQTATVLSGASERTCPVGEVAVGEHILIRPGDRIPLDGRVLDGVSTIDTAALTGESLPREAAPGDVVLAGTVNKTGVLTVEVTAAAAETVAARMLRLVEEASDRKAPAERFITRFARIYTPVVMLLAVVVALIQPLINKDVAIYGQVYAALVFLVTACPCALVISIPLAYFAGVGGAARAGILVKGSAAMDVLAQTGMVIFDKTGTLTEGRFAVSEVHPAPGVSADTLARCAAIAEMRSHHPLAACLRDYCGDVGYPADRCLEMPGLGVSAQFEGQMIHAGSARYMRGLGIDTPDAAGTVVHIALDDRALGYYTLCDTPRPDSGRAVALLKKMGIQTAMLTGDTPEAAAQTAELLGIDNVRAGLLPEGKLEAMESLMAETQGSTLFVGDGLNDAAALARADAGVAMGASGVDAALEAADVVLVSDNPARLVDGIVRARRTRTVAMQNIIGALGFKAAVLVLATMGIAPLWAAVAADVGVALLAVLNALRARS